MMNEISPSLAYQKSKERSRYPLTENFHALFPFDFDEFQIQACHQLEDGNGVLVAAPTGSGKTIVGEFATHLALNSGSKCFYTTPVKALSNQKYNDLVEKHGVNQVGLLTGDSNLNSEAPILVMTTEVLRNMIYANSSTLDDLSYVVMDEVHFLADKFRGAVWEEILIHLDPEIKIVSLSATVSNVEEFGDWLSSVRGRTSIIVSEIRPVPLYQHVLVGHRLLDLFESPGKINRELLKAEKRELDSRSVRGRNSGFLDKNALITRLANDDYLPAIFFIFSRAGCDAAAQRAVRDGLNLTTALEKIAIRDYVSSRTSHLAGEDLKILKFEEWQQALEKGIALHHAGMLPLFKEITEGLFQLGYLKIVFATETLALGINMPARTVILEKLIKWNGESHVAITPGEYTQLTGRAGRRGIDIEGNSIIMWSPSIDAAMAASLAGTRTYPLRSSFVPSYNMSANLIEKMSVERAKESLALSFAQYQADKSVLDLNLQIARNRKAISAFSISCHLGDFESYFKLRLEIKEIERSPLSHRAKNRHQELELRSEKISEIRREMRSHPSHGCPDREIHAREMEKITRLERETENLENKVSLRRNVIPRTFEKILEILSEFGYFSQGKLTESGRVLLNIFSESDLLITEILRKGIFVSLKAIEIPALLSGILYQSRSDDRQLPRIPKNLDSSIQEVLYLWSTINDLELSYGINTQKEPDYSLSWSVYRWSSGNTITSILRETDVNVGDFVRHIKQVIDLIGQLISADPKNGDKYYEALKNIDRGIIQYASVTG
ncbi:MAG: DEAD/DEAH box helicase [Actinomycetota bacterium]|nr:DEAD/DEAH box helicase [Actinomycetota bacterium]